MQKALIDDDFKTRLAESDAEFHAMLAASNENFKRSLADSKKRIKAMIWRETAKISVATALACAAWLGLFWPR